jgi:hypothetical protein
MKYKLSGTQLAQIMCEQCLKYPGHVHLFRADPDRKLEVRCHWCGLEVDFNAYTCSRQGEQPAGFGAREDSPAPEWLDSKFHS